MARTLRLNAESPLLLVGVGGIGTGMFFELEGNKTLGRNESRPGRLLDIRDYCKLHIIAHYVSVLLGADESGRPFHSVPVGKVGDDTAGERLKREMAAAGMDLQFVGTVPDRPTLFSVCFQYPDGSGGNITASGAAAAALSGDEVAEVEPLLAENEGSSIVLAAPEAPLEARMRLLVLGTKCGAFRAVAVASSEIEDALRLGMFQYADLVALNENEAGAVLGRAFDPSDIHAYMLDLNARLLTFNDEMKVLLSAGRQGAFAVDEWVVDCCPAMEVEVVSTAGAGDALLSGVLAGLAAGLPLTGEGEERKKITDRPVSSALDLGVLLAGYSVTSPHTIHPGADLDSLVAFVREKGIFFSEEMEAVFPAGAGQAESSDSAAREEKVLPPDEEGRQDV